jgi:hypothetical protein
MDVEAGVRRLEDGWGVAGAEAPIPKSTWPTDRRACMQTMQKSRCEALSGGCMDVEAGVRRLEDGWGVAGAEAPIPEPTLPTKGPACIRG